MKLGIENELIDIKRKSVFQLYLDQFDRFISDAQTEKSAIKGYQGREILELIQNAEDESKNRNGILKITFLDNQLRIENSGNPFSYKGILSLMTARYSPKDSQLFIGNKGLGFRSVLSWSDSVSIFSEKIAVRFSKEDAASMQEDLKGRISPEKINDYRFDSFSIPVFSAPNTKCEREEPSSGMDTLIVLDCKKEALDRIHSQINDITGKELLFLNNIGKIIIKTDTLEKEYVIADDQFEEIENSSIKKRKSIISFSGKEAYIYSIYQQTGEMGYYDSDENTDKKKKFLISLAIPEGDSIVDEYLYSYFRTRIKSPFSFILNCTFELNDFRNGMYDSVSGNDFNSRVIDELPKFIIDSVIDYYSSSHNYDYLLLNTLSLKEKSFLSTDGYTFSSKYLSAIKTAKVFPTVNNKYISFEQKPVLITECRFAEILTGEHFENLLKYTEEKNVIDFYKWLGSYYYPQESMKTKINSSLNLFTNNQKCELVRLFVQYYDTRKDRTNDYPNLLEDSNGVVIISNDSKIFNQPKEEELSKIPNFVSIRFLNKRYFDYLKNYLDIKDGNSNVIREVIAKWLKNFGVSEYSFSALEGTINATFDSLSDIKQNIELINWVYKIYKTQDKIPDLPKIKAKVPAKKDNNVVSIESTKVYFNEAYQNPFYARLLRRASPDNVYFLLKKEKLNLGDEKTEDLVPFFMWLGVDSRPRIILHSFIYADISEYRQYLSTFSIWQNHRIYNCSIWKYEFFESIMSNCDSMDILKWLLDENEDQNSVIKNTRELSGAKMMASEDKPYARSYTYEGASIPSYTRWKISTIKWLEAKNSQNKAALTDFILENFDIAPFMFIPKIDYKDLSEYNTDYTETKVNAFLESLGLTVKLKNLSYGRYYKLLKSLPSLDKDHKYTRSIYTTLMDKTKEEGPGQEYKTKICDLDEYKDFVNHGEVLSVMDKRNKIFSLANQTYYSDRKDLCDGILKSYPIFDMERRAGQDKISFVFGVKTLKHTNVEILASVKNDYDADFQKLLKQIKPYIVVHRGNLSKEKVDLIKGIQISLCNSVKIRYELNGKSEIYDLQNFESIYSRDNKIAYINVKSIFSDFLPLRTEYRFYECLAELLTIIFDVDREKEIYKNLIRDTDEIRLNTIIDTFGERGRTLLEEAKKILGDIVTPKEKFISTIANLKGNHMAEVVSQNYNQVDYLNINAKSNQEILIRLFKETNVSIADFNANTDGEIIVHIDSYWQEQFQSIIGSMIEKYKTYKYQELKIATCKTRYKVFEHEVKKFKFSTIDINSNDANFDLYDYFFSCFHISINELDMIQVIDLNEIKARNMEQYKNQYPEKFDKQIKKYGNIVDEVSLFYEFDELIISEENELPSPQTTSIDKTGEINKIIDKDTTSPTSVEVEPTETSLTNNYNSVQTAVGSVGNNGVYASQQTKDDNGYAAERKVFKELSSKYGKDNVKWISTNAERAGEIPKGAGDDTKHYDIEYKRQNDSHSRYVEVKEKKNSKYIEFEMSRGEFDFGSDPKNIDYYDIHFIRLGESFSVDEYFIIEEFFIPDENGCKKYELIQNSFLLKTKVVQEK
jgi:hypothetical protein